MMTDALAPNAQALLTRIAERALAHDVFDSAEVKGSMVYAHATDSPEEAFYRVEIDEEGVFVSWASEDRYISQSIEAELMWTGDDLDDMIDEGAQDAGWTLGRMEPLKHYRDEGMHFVYRSKTPIAPADADAGAHADQLVAAMAGYAEAMAEFGDMKPESDDD